MIHLVAAWLLILVFLPLLFGWMMQAKTDQQFMWRMVGLFVGGFVLTLICSYIAPHGAFRP